MKTFYIKNGKEKEVKNLRWVLDYARRNKIRMIFARQENGVFHDAILQVHFQDGIVFESEFASFNVLIDWLHARRSWKGSLLYVYVFGHFSSKKYL